MEKITKKKLIHEYKEGDFVDDIFVVKFKKGVSDYVKGYYFALILTDSSGKSIEYRYWGGPEESKVREIYDEIKSDSVIHLEGQFSIYRGKPQIASNQEHKVKVLQEDMYDKEDFIKKAEKDLEELYRKLETYIEKVQDMKIKNLLQEIFLKELKHKFKTHPAAISIHHNYIGGLLEHTLQVLRYCETSKEIFPKLNEDLLIAGALLHDIGKLEEIETTTRIKGTNKGMFVGHLVLGSIFVSKKMDELGFDEEIKNKILHLIVSHHGKIEFGSPKEPIFPEAFVLYYADELSSKTQEVLDFIEDNKDETEDDFMYYSRKRTNIFLR